MSELQGIVSAYYVIKDQNKSQPASQSVRYA